MSAAVVDERDAKPSASAFDSDFRCLGRRALIEAMKVGGRYVDKQSPAAARGQRIHTVLEGKETIDSLTAESDKITAAICMNEEAKLVEKYGFEGARVVREQRLWMTDDNMEPAWSTRLDVVHVKGESSLVIDYKTGFTSTVPIGQNWQMKGQAVATAFHMGMKTVVVALVHPHHPESMVESVVIEGGELERITASIEGLVKELNADAPRTPNAISCAYCPARKECPEHAAMIKEAFSTRQNWDTMTPAERGTQLHAFKAQEDIIETVRDVYKEMLKKDARSVDGWRLMMGKSRGFTNQEKAIELITAEFGEDAATASMELSLTALEKHLVDIGKAKGKTAKEVVNDKLAPVLTWKEQKAKLIESKGVA